MNDYSGTEKRVSRFTDDEIEEIANAAAERVLEKVYSEVGKSVLKKLSWLAGAAVVGIATWLTSKGYLSK